VDGRRTQAASAWEARRVVALPPKPGGRAPGVVVPGVTDEGEETPEDVGAVDPVAGLMRMQVGAVCAHCLGL